MFIHAGNAGVMTSSAFWQERNICTHSTFLGTATRSHSSEKHAPLQSAKRKQLTSGCNFFVPTHLPLGTRQPHFGARSRSSLSLINPIITLFWPRFLDQTSFKGCRVDRNLTLHPHIFRGNVTYVSKSGILGRIAYPHILRYCSSTGSWHALIGFTPTPTHPSALHTRARQYLLSRH